MNQTAPLEAGMGVIALESMVAFYTEALDCREERRADIPAELSAPLGLAEHGYTCVWLVTPGGERIKLMSTANPPAPQQASPFSTSRTGLAYLTFYVSDLTSTLERALALGAHLRSDPDLAAPGKPLRLCFFQDPEGNVIELVEVAEGGQV